MTIDRKKILDECQAFLVRIDVTGRNIAGSVVQRRSGTGIVVGSNGLIITAGHVVGRDEDWAETFPGTQLLDRAVSITALDNQRVERSLGKASVLHVPGYDVALLNVNARQLPAVSLAEFAPRNENTLLVALLWEEGGVPRPLIAELTPTTPSLHGGHLTVGIKVIEGNSGSGLFDEQSRLCGIITRRLDDDRALAIPIEWISSQLKSHMEPLTASLELRTSTTSSTASKQLSEFPDLRSFAQECHLPVVIADSEMRLIVVNTRALEILDVAPDRVVNRPIEDAAFLLLERMEPSHREAYAAYQTQTLRRMRAGEILNVNRTFYLNYPRPAHSRYAGLLRLDSHMSRLHVNDRQLGYVIIYTVQAVESIPDVKSFNFDSDHI